MAKGGRRIVLCSHDFADCVESDMKGMNANKNAQKCAKVQVNLSQFSRGSIKATRNHNLTHDYNKLLESV